MKLLKNRFNKSLLILFFLLIIVLPIIFIKPFSERTLHISWSSSENLIYIFVLLSQLETIGFALFFSFICLKRYNKILKMQVFLFYLMPICRLVVYFFLTAPMVISELTVPLLLILMATAFLVFVLFKFYKAGVNVYETICFLISSIILNFLPFLIVVCALLR
jgi:hypothetical protein